MWSVIELKQLPTSTEISVEEYNSAVWAETIS